MNHSSRSPRPRLLVAFVAVCLAGCDPQSGTPTGAGPSGGSQGNPGTGGRGTSGSGGGNTNNDKGTGGALATGGAATGGAEVSTGGAANTGGMVGTGGAATGGKGGIEGTGGTTAGSGGATNTGGKGGGGTGGPGTGGRVVPSGCTLPATVSFKTDVQPILTASCGKNTGGGCHVVDGSSTVGSLCPDGTRTCGFTHAYDWITAGSHDSSCPETPNPKRFEVTIAVINGGNPLTCSRSRKMPPPGMGTPLTACQIATLQAWIDLPKVTQMHRSDDSSPPGLYPMPPFN